MKKIIKFAYFAYHGIFPSRFGTCRFSPTCSKYALEAVEKYGIAKGFYLSMKRVLSCHPLSNRPTYDPA